MENNKIELKGILLIGLLVALGVTLGIMLYSFLPTIGFHSFLILLWVMLLAISVAISFLLLKR